MYTVAAFNATQMSIVAASQIISAAELNTGDRLLLYDQNARQLGTTYVVSVASVNAPPGINSSTPDPVFSTTFAGYSYLNVSPLLSAIRLSRIGMVSGHSRWE